MYVSSGAVFAVSDAVPEPPTLTRSLSMKSSAARAKPGNAAPRKFASKVACRAMGGNYYRRARTGHSHDFNDDVRPRRRARRFGPPHPPVTRDPKTIWWIHGVRAAGIHPREHAPLPSWWSKTGSEA